jgi:hypothetical protein
VRPLLAVYFPAALPISFSMLARSLGTARALSGCASSAQELQIDRVRRAVVNSRACKSLAGGQPYYLLSRAPLAMGMTRETGLAKQGLRISLIPIDRDRSAVDDLGIGTAQEQDHARDIFGFRPLRKFCLRHCFAIGLCVDDAWKH